MFIDGCFWHGCPICYRAPQSNQKYWSQKLKKNIARDEKVNSQLTGLGWTVVRFWEHDIIENLQECIDKVRLHITL